jgi:hypothetical protein
LSTLFQSRGLSHTETATVFLPYLSKYFTGGLPPWAADIGLFPGSSAVVGHGQVLAVDAVADDEEEMCADAEELIIEEFD